MTLEKSLTNALRTHDKKEIESVFNEIYHAYVKLIYYIVAQYIKNHDDIEELCNDVFLNFFNHLDCIKIKNIKYYLTTSAKNSALNWLKKNNNKYVSVINEPKVSEYNRNICDYLKQFLERDEENLIFEHIYLGKSLRLIAKENNINPNTLKSKYRRIIEKLRMKVGVDFE